MPNKKELTKKNLITALIIGCFIFGAVVDNYENKTNMLEAIIDGYCIVIKGEVYCDDGIIDVTAQQPDEIRCRNVYYE